VECCTPIATCSAPAAATNAENFTESASAAIGAGTNTPNVPDATPADSAANPASVAAEVPTAAGSIPKTITNLLEQANPIEKIVTRSGGHVCTTFRVTPSPNATAREIDAKRSGLQSALKVRDAAAPSAGAMR
jgi:hypothetical protein